MTRHRPLMFSLIVLSLILYYCDMRMQSEVTTEINPETVQVTNKRGRKTDLAWSPDGSMIAFAGQHESTNLYLYSLNKNKRELIKIFEEPFYGRPALSPDDRYLAYCYDGKYLWRFSLEDGSEQLLWSGEDVTMEDLSWSPDGSMIAYAGKPHRPHSVFNIWIIPSTSGEPQQITFETTHDCRNPCWSPDGTKLAYEFWESPNCHIWIISLEDGSRRRLTSTPAKNMYPVWSPDGTMIAFSSERNDTTGIWIISVANGKERKVSPDMDYANYPAWSPNGSKIAFKTYQGICMCSINGTDLICISQNVNEIFPIWLSDGEHILGTLYNGAISIIGVVSLSDGQINPLTIEEEPYQQHTHPTWFSDCDRIAFIKKGNIWVTSVSGESMVPLTKNSLGNMNNPEISPDDTKIIYDNGYDIFIQAIEGGDALCLTEHIGEQLTQPTWAPDGKQIACCSPYGLKVFSIESDQLVEQAFVPGSFSDPVWSKNHPIFGSHIVVEGSWRIYLISPGNWKPELLIPRGHAPCWSPDGTKIAYVFGGGDLIYVTTVFKELENGN